ncbi:MAG: hypothetical protein PHS84_10840 [Paludibacter sp.]|jgi:hypothetical protein|nr:hypothetical protein [Paludibacter sp.]
MKTQKKSAISFQKLDAAQMQKIGGGVWVEVTDPDGKKTLIWV